jgi:hypothetical protein
LKRIQLSTWQAPASTSRASSVIMGRAASACPAVSKTRAAAKRGSAENSGLERKRRGMVNLRGRRAARAGRPIIGQRAMTRQ